MTTIISYKKNFGEYAKLRVAEALNSFALVLESVRSHNPLPQDAGSVTHPGSHSLPSW